MQKIWIDTTRGREPVVKIGGSYMENVVGAEVNDGLVTVTFKPDIVYIDSERHDFRQRVINKKAK